MTTGLFTNAQSVRGRRIFGAHCASCHGAEMESVIGPAHAGSTFQGKAFDRRVRFTDTFIKRDGWWQVQAIQGTPIQ